MPVGPDQSPEGHEQAPRSGRRPHFGGPAIPVRETADDIPRTDSQYVTTADLETLRGLTEGDRRVEGFIDPDVKPNQPRLELTVNDAKVAGHAAILPTMRADARALDELGEDERLVLTRVVRRMWEAMGDDYVHDTTMVIANIDPYWCEKHPEEGRLLSEGECRFISRSDQPVSLGWHAIEHAKPQEDLDDDNDMAGNIIPANLATGVSIAPIPHGGATLSEGQTKPPKPFTEATLLAAMEHASRWVEDKELKAALDDDESHSGGISTPATRTDVIEKLIRTGYVERKGKQLRSTRQGQSLIDVIAPRLKDVALTADMERQLSQVEHNHADPTQVEMEFRDLAAGIPRTRRTLCSMTMCRRRHGTRNRSATTHAAANPSSNQARCSNAPPTDARNSPTAHGRPRKDAAGAPGRPSPARPSPTPPCAGCLPGRRSA